MACGEQGHLSECLARAEGLGWEPSLTPQNPAAAPGPQGGGRGVLLRLLGPYEVAGPYITAVGPGGGFRPGGDRALALTSCLFPLPSPAAWAASSPGWSLLASVGLLWERQNAFERKLVSGTPSPQAAGPADKLGCLHLGWERVSVAKGVRDQPHSVNPRSWPGSPRSLALPRAPPSLRAVSTGGPCPQQ